MSDSFDNDSFDDLDSFAGDYKPEQPFELGLDTLADGDYTFEIVSAELTKTQNGDRILNLTIRPNGGGPIRHTYWLTRQTEMNKLGADMAVLGFDSHKWGKQIPISKALPDTVAKLKGIRFLGAKRTSIGKKDGKTFHNLYVNARVTVDQKPGAGPALANKQAPPQAPAAQNYGEIPF